MYQFCSLPPLSHTRLDLLPPPQTAPEDLRVVARKIEFPIVQADSSTTPVGVALIEDDELIEDFDELGTESVHSQRSSDSGSGYPGQHECPDCGKTYSTSSNLARHRQTHRYDKIYNIISDSISVLLFAPAHYFDDGCGIS